MALFCKGDEYKHIASMQELQKTHSIFQIADILEELMEHSTLDSSRENHCGSCEKAFCCFSCRSKHEIYVHKRIKPDSTRKVFAQIRNVMFQSHNSLPKIPESVPIDCQDFESNTLKKKQRRLSICIYKDNSNLSQLGNQLKSDDRDETTREETKNIYTETVEEYNSTNSILTDDKMQANDVHRLKFSENVLNVIVNVDEKIKYFGLPSDLNNSESPEGIENIHSNQINISENCNFSSRTAGNTPPRTQEFKMIDSIPKGQSTTNENSSVYCPCFENLTISGFDSRWINGASDRSDSLFTGEITECKNSEHLERSSIYFACSEYFTKEYSADKLSGIGISAAEGFNTFEIDPEIASTKSEMTISFTPEPYSEAQSELRTQTIDSTDAEYLTPNMKEFPDDTNIASNIDNFSNDNVSDSTLSAYQNSVPILLNSVCSINTEEFCKVEHHQEIMMWLKNGQMQTSTEGSSTFFEVNSRVTEDSRENEIPIYKTVQGANDQESTLSTSEHPSVAIGDNSLWQSFSNSIQRAYNSTKEICSSIGRKNRSKRELDDLEELQPAPKRPKISILCRPPIRDNPRIIFRQDGDTRRPVILYDKGTQTDLLY